MTESNPTQLTLSESHTEQPVQIDSTCPRCGGERDKLLVRLFEKIMELRSRLARVDPEGPLL